VRHVLWTLALVCTACLGEAEDGPDAGTGGGVDVAGGSPADGRGGSASEGDAGFDFPMSNPDCAPDAVVIEARLLDDGPFTRADLAPIEYVVYAQGQVQVFGRSQDGGNFTAPAEGRLTFNTGGGPDDPLGANVPLWQGTYRVELAAQDARGCVGQTHLDLPVVGDVLVGDTDGALHVRGSDGRWVVSLGDVSGHRISSLILAPDADREFIAGFGAGLEGGPFLARLAADGSLLSRFAEVDLQGEPLFETGAPRHVFYDAAADEILCDGVPDGRVLRFNLLGDFLGDHRVPGGDSGDHGAIGFSRLGGRMVAGNAAHDKLYFLGEPAELFVDTGGSFNEVYALAPGPEDAVLVAQTEGDYTNRLVLYGDGGQQRRAGTIDALEPEHVVAFRDGFLMSSGFDGLRRVDASLTLLAPDADGDRWNDYGGFGFGTITSLVWLNPRAPR
jgi:hypothetical protein